MKFEKTQSEGLNHAYTITVPFESINQKKEQKLVKISKTAKMDGFRPGKVPMKVLEQRYAGSVISEIIEDTIDEKIKSIMTENSIKAASRPKADIVSFEEGQDLVFSFSVESMPVVDVKDFSSINLVKPILKAQDKKVEEKLEDLRARNNVYQDSKKAAKDEDRVQFSLETSYSSGAKIKDLSSEKIDFVIGKTFVIKEISDALKGAKAGDEIALKDVVLTDLNDKKYKGKKVDINIVVLCVEEPKEATLDDTLATTLGYENLEAMKKEVQAEVQGELDMYARLYVKRFLLDNLSDSYTFDVPSSMVDQEFESIWKKLQEEMKAAKESGEDSEELNKSEDELKAEYKNIAARRVRLGLLISEIAKANSLSLTKEEVSKAAWREAMRFGQMFRQAYDYIMKNRNALEAAAAPALEDKVIDFILEQVKLEEKDMSFDEFKKLADGVIPVDFSEEEAKSA
ncbi:MAG TPA: trigger factor [Alphaproteobacteria bacterium]|nr:trigger factor [Alphaproteobacteria bacterium]